MIDYDKLKLAHELADKYSKKNKQMVRISYELYTFEEYESKFRMYIFDWHDDFYHSIDDLITKLQELTQSEPQSRYKVGDIVWMLVDDEPYETRVDSVCGLKYYLYKFTSGLVCESLIYPTKAELIEAQIFYWRDQLSEELEQYVSDYCTSKPHVGTANRIKEDCQHESDGIMHKMGDLDGLLPVRELGYKCIKCGEFYR